MKKLFHALIAGILAVTAAASFAQDKSATPTDPQIAAIMMAINTAEINAGKLAKSNAQHKEVKAFAQQMITDHTGVNKQVSALVKKLKVKAEENATSKSLMENGKKNLADLKPLKGAEFDKAYIGQQITLHQQALDMIDGTLLPNAQNADLKDLITKVRPNIEAHRDHAKKIQDTLNKS